MNDMLIINVGLTWNLIIISFKYLLKDYLVYTILVIYLEIDLLEKFNLNLGYILIKTPNFNNQDDKLYKMLY